MPWGVVTLTNYSLNMSFEKEFFIPDQGLLSRLDMGRYSSFLSFSSGIAQQKLMVRQLQVPPKAQ